MAILKYYASPPQLCGRRLRQIGLVWSARHEDTVPLRRPQASRGCRFAQPALYIYWLHHHCLVRAARLEGEIVLRGAQAPHRHQPDPTALRRQWLYHSRLVRAARLGHGAAVRRAQAARRRRPAAAVRGRGVHCPHSPVWGARGADAVLWRAQAAGRHQPAHQKVRGRWVCQTGFLRTVRQCTVLCTTPAQRGYPHAAAA
jgi:hypothetical protein